MKKAKCIWISILCFALVFVMGGGGVFSAFLVKSSAAETINSIETSDPLEDLKGSTIDGVPFDVKNYNPATNKNFKILLLAEVGYGSSDLNDYNLYLYVYSPGYELYDGPGLFDRSNIFLRSTIKTNYTNCVFFMDIVGVSIDPVYGGHFYKYKIDFEYDEKDYKSDFYYSLTPSNRVYSIFLLGLNGKDRISVNTDKVFAYSGFTKGTGGNSEDEGNLLLKVDQEDALRLDVKSTYFRLPYIKNAQGTESECVIDAQDTLHSVYFSVPNHYIEEYGKMSKVHAMWYDAVLKPSLVLGDATIYNSALPYVDKSGIGLDGLEYRFYSDFYTRMTEGIIPHTYRYYGYSWNVVPEDEDGLVSDHFAHRISDLKMLYLADSLGVNSADTYVLPGETIHSYVLKRSQEIYNASKDTVMYTFAEETFALDLFESLNTEPTIVELAADDEFTLESQLVDKKWWQLFSSSETVTSFDDKNVKAIHAVTAADFELPSIQKAVESGFVNEEEYNAFLESFASSGKTFIDHFAPLIADSLCVSRADFSEFKQYYDEKIAKGETVYLFRYKTSDYLCEEVRITDLIGSVVSTNGYFFQSAVDLGFKIIDVTFLKDGMETVVDVVMNPINIFLDATPPVQTTPDPEPKDDGWFDDFIQILLLVVLIIICIVVLPLLWPLIRPVLEAIFSILSLPFRAIGSLFKRRR